MTNEVNRGISRMSLDEQIKFVKQRMIENYDTARTYALKADKIMRDFDPSGLDTRAQQQAINDKRRRDAIDVQQMYDRWTTRDASVLNALLQYKETMKDEHPRAIPHQHQAAA